MDEQDVRLRTFLERLDKLSREAGVYISGTNGALYPKLVVGDMDDRTYSAIMDGDICLVTRRLIEKK